MKDLSIFSEDSKEFLSEADEVKILGGINCSESSQLKIYLSDCPFWGDCKTTCNLDP